MFVSNGSLDDSNHLEIIFESSKHLWSHFNDSEGDSEARINFLIDHDMESELKLELPYLTVTNTGYLFRIGTAKLARCPACWTNNETLHHFLLWCPAYAYVSQMIQLEGTLCRATRLISTPLVNPKAFPYLFRYVHGAHNAFTTPSETYNHYKPPSWK